MELQEADRARGLRLKTGSLQGCLFLLFARSGCPALPWHLTRGREGREHQAVLLRTVPGGPGISTRGAERPCHGYGVSRSVTGNRWLLIIRTKKQKGPETGPLEQVFLVAGGQDEASGEAWALAHLPATKAVLCL